MKEAGLVITEILPISKQPKTEWVARVPVNFFSYEVLATKDPRPLLKDMATKMRNYLSEWDGLVRDYSGRTIDQIGSRGLPEQVRKSKEAFVDEIERFERGIKSLDDDEVRLAFQLMNMSFFVRNSKAEPENISWRSFQLAFIVSILPDILTREQNNSEELTRTMPATVLWLPTGAGKTEAFTGVILVQAFYDRIRGKDGGVSAVLKFPLRFLSMQQLERAVMAATAANKVLISRKGDIDASRRKRGLQRHEYDQFSVGYFVGSGGRPNDPNKVLDSGLSAIEEIRAGMKSADRFKFISVCPDCQIEGRGTNSIELKGDTNRNRIYHICKKCGREVPLYITDVEVFARLPTMVISTIDKWATISTIPESKTIFGIVRSRCPTHGYSCFDDKCMFLPRDKRCSSVNKMPALYDGPPSIMVQDELHMLGESLGALASQYETFLKNLAGTVGSVEGMSSKGQWKIIASTATIAGYERHMKSMYLKDSDIFPVKGPSASQSFYFSHNKEMAQRLIVGFVPHSMTHPNAVIKTLQYFHAFVKRFEQEPGKLAKDYPSMFARLTPTEESNLFKLVRTSLMYGIVKSETYQILNSVEDQIDPYLKSVGIKDGIKETADVTGDTDPQDNIELLQKMKDPSLPSNPEFIVATSSISHGVDIRQLNFMTFRGQPRSVAEYIQAMSRVGRKYQGIVFAIYNPNRERDASHYMLHNEFLSIADVLISPPAVDRFSRQAVDKSADGIIMGGMMFRERDKRLIRASEFVARQRDPKFLTGLKQFFISSYLPAGSESMVPDFDSFERYVSDTFDVKIRNAVNLFERGRGIWTPELFDCLQNLRKTDEEVDLFLTDPDVQERVSEIKRSSLVVKK